MKVERVWEAPRVTKPYTEEQWAKIEKLGHAIDAQLLSRRRAPDHGRRTHLRFASTIRMAPSGTPRPWARQAPPRGRCVRRLKQKYAPQGLSHFGQGKWYPGEQLPRWSLNCFWRRDGEPIWQNPALLDDEETRSRRHRRRWPAHSWPRWRGSLGLAPEHIFAAYEDAFYYLWRERRLPGNVDPFESRLEDPAGARAPAPRCSSRACDTVIGHVLPITRDAVTAALAHRAMVPAA